MKKLITSLILLLSIGTSNATHVYGGQISWECGTNGTYIFTLDLYTDCVSAVTIPAMNQTISTNALMSNIQCSLVGTTDISKGCYDPMQSITCITGTTTAIFGAMEKITYVSSPITLTGTPPLGGWSFNHVSCCRPIMQNAPSSGYFVESKMFVHNAGGCLYDSPKFAEEPSVVLVGNGSYSSMASLSTVGDSIHHSLVTPMILATQPIAYNSGYSALAPFPDSTESSMNGPVTMNGLTGDVSFNIQNFGSSSGKGLYAYAVKAESWRNGLLYAEVTREAMAMIDIGSANSNPVMTLNTALASHTVQSISPNFKSVHCFSGDTLFLRVNSQDFDFNGSFPQAIAFEASGTILETMWNGAGGQNAASLTPVSPQTGYIQALQNNIDFKWIIPSGSSSVGSHVVNFTIHDDACPYPGYSHISLLINVSEALSISQDTVGVCDGDSIQVTGFSTSNNYLWSPSNNISNTTVASPFFYPSTSQYYYLMDPSSSSAIDSVFIEVEPSAQLSLSYAAAILTPSANTTLDSHQWYFNGIPFLHSFSALTPFGSGLYYVEGTHGPCNEASNITAVAAGSFKTIITPTNGSSLNVPIQVMGSLGVDFYLTDPDHVKLKGINLIGLYNGKPKQAALGNNLNVKLYEKATQTELWSTDVSITQQGDLLHIPLSFNQFVLGTEYTLAVTGDTSLYFMAYQGVAFPYEPDNNGLSVIGANEGIAQQYPSVPTDKVLPLSLEFLNSIDLNEDKTVDISIFPNPIKDKLVISGLRNDINYDFEIVDAGGRLVYQIKVKSKKEVSINTRDWPSGVYFIMDKNQVNSNPKKIIKE